MPGHRKNRRPCGCQKFEIYNKGLQRETANTRRNLPTICECFFVSQSYSLNASHTAYQMSDHRLQDQRAIYCLGFVMLKNRESIPALAESIRHNESCKCCGPFYPTLGLGPFLFKHPFPQAVKLFHLFSMPCSM